MGNSLGEEYLDTNPNPGPLLFMWEPLLYQRSLWHLLINFYLMLNCLPVFELLN